MKKWIIRKPEMYRAMREASFSPGVAATVLIVFFMLVVNYIVREIPASIIDYTYYASHPTNNSSEALQIVLNYATAPSTMLWALSLTVIMIGIVVLYVKRAEKRPLATIGLSHERIAPRFAVGYLLGFVLLILSTAWEAASRTTVYTGFQSVALLFIPLYIIQASSEEILFRGYMLSSITVKTGVIRAVLFTSFLFALLHVGDTNILVLVQLFFLGVLCALLTVRTNSLWAACGVHAAWNFAFGLFSPVTYGHITTSYSMFTFGSSDTLINWGVFGGPGTLPAIALIIIMIVLVLFVGKNRVIARATEGEQMVFRAQEIAQKALAPCKDEFGKPYIRHSVGVMQMLETDAERTAVLLADACNMGGLAPDSLTGFSADVLTAVNALIRGDDTDLEYGTQVRSNPAALAVWTAQLLFEEKLLIEKTEWNNRRSKTASRRPDIYHCPMLRRDIRRAECLDIIPMVEDYADDDAHAALRYLDRGRCMRCAKHNSMSISVKPQNESAAISQ